MTIGQRFASRDYNLPPVVLEELCGLQKLLAIVGEESIGNYLFVDANSRRLRLLPIQNVITIETDAATGYLYAYREVLPSYYWLFAMTIKRGYELRIPRGQTVRIPNYEEPTRLTTAP